jgi:hypothetical protein
VYVRVQGGGFNAGGAVFTGNVLTNLQRVAATTDAAKPGTLQFQALAGVDYAIAVDGQGGQSGPFTLILSAPGLVGPPRLRIDPPPADGNIVLRCEDCVPGQVVIFVSSDLVQWQPITTNQIAPGAPITLPPDGQSRRFYRFRFE